MLAMAGMLLVEINLLKLALAIVIMIVLPGVLLGLAPLVVTGWYALFSRGLATIESGVVPALSLLMVLAAAWFGGRPLYLTAERGFWSLISVIEPVYALLREGLRHLGEALHKRVSPRRRRALDAAATALAGLILCALALTAVVLVWPSTRWIGSIWDLRFPQRLIVPTLANSVVLVGSFFAAAPLVWALADASMPQPRPLRRFDEAAPGARIWRVAHISDLHAVGGEYEFRIESGRRGPRGNGRMKRALERLADEHAARPVDIVLMSGDMTDCGRSTEWAEFLGALREHPELARLALILPGNHDLNVVDRTNPARLELPLSIGRTLRQMRALSAMAAVQGDRVFVRVARSGPFDRTLSAFLNPHAQLLRDFADQGGYWRAWRLSRLWAEAFPMVLPPPEPGGLGVILLNSNAEANFSFTNALGLVSSDQIRDMQAAMAQYPKARWLVALHHHLLEYPGIGSVFAARIGTALINGSAFARALRPLGRRIIALHGHRHFDWIGACGETRIVSAPSPVMNRAATRSFLIQHFAEEEGGGIALLEPQRVNVRTSAIVA
ncbi:MAG: metallophosphoesterase [Salinarimonadaceae bacterium]|nr:MAG: metallophosphoesterase [Salinarimonadaceae bacterium]